MFSIKKKDSKATNSAELKKYRIIVECDISYQLSKKQSLPFHQFIGKFEQNIAKNVKKGG